jgi:hypothetical protein
VASSRRYLVKFKVDGEPNGPYSPNELRHLVEAGMLTEVGLIAEAGSRRWVPAGRVKGLFPVAPTGLVELKRVQSEAGRPEIQPGRTRAASGTGSGGTDASQRSDSRSESQTTARSGLPCFLGVCILVTLASFGAGLLVGLIA